MASFSVPYRPKLFGKVKPMVLNLSPAALEKDEVFLFLVFVYCESKRQDKMVRLVPSSPQATSDVCRRYAERFWRLAGLSWPSNDSYHASTNSWTFWTLFPHTQPAHGPYLTYRITPTSVPHSTFRTFEYIHPLSEQTSRKIRSTTYELTTRTLSVMSLAF